MKERDKTRPVRVNKFSRTGRGSCSGTIRAPQAILPPTGTDWRADYEFAAAVRAACR
jgi:hypothetical protein